MEIIDLPPKADSLMESMRDVGYSFESAIADLIDNCVSAGARHISIRFSAIDPPYVAVLDDGRGMSPAELTQAMRPGSQNPRETRSTDDLGRFGLGLKTASLSQCRRLTVVSQQDSSATGREWDLDFLNQVGDWKLKALAGLDISELPAVDQLGPRGTAVIWRGLDRLRENFGETSFEAGMAAAMDRAQRHLELVFHRFLSGEAGLTKISININGHQISPADPFGLSFPATQILNRESVRVAGGEVHIQPYVLPHHSKITAAEYERLGGEDGHLRNQGFYIYRNKRLITSGTWFRLARQSELTKLARVQVDIPNTLDHLWTIDVKKSFAFPPEAVRKELKRVIDQIIGRSERVYNHRGQRTLHDGYVHVWDRTVKHSKIRYALNRDHPLIQGLLETLQGEHADDLSDLLSLIEGSLPLDALFADLAGKHQQVIQEQQDDPGVLERLAASYLELLRASGIQESEIKTRLLAVEPFCSRREAVLSLMNQWGLKT